MYYTTFITTQQSQNINTWCIICAPCFLIFWLRDIGYWNYLQRNKSLTASNATHSTHVKLYRQFNSIPSPPNHMYLPKMLPMYSTSTTSTWQHHNLLIISHSLIALTSHQIRRSLHRRTLNLGLCVISRGGGVILFSCPDYSIYTVNSTLQCK